jgi:PAS domain S-box-containing protein
MRNQSKKKEPLIAELATLQQRVVDLEKKATEYQRVFDALSVSEIQYRRLFETAQDGILILDAKTGQITDVNPFMVNILGYNPGELLGKTLWEVGPFKNIKASQDVFSDLQTKGYIRYENLPLETKEGKSIAVEFVSNVYDVDHKRVIQCNIRDITKRKQAEEMLREEEEHPIILLSREKGKSSQNQQIQND